MPSIYLQNHLNEASTFTPSNQFELNMLFDLYFICHQFKPNKTNKHLTQKSVKFTSSKKNITFPIFHVIQLLLMIMRNVKAEATELMAKAWDRSCWGKLGRMSIPKCETTGKPRDLGVPILLFYNSSFWRLIQQTGVSISGNISKIPKPKCFRHLGGWFPYNHHHLGEFPQWAGR